MRAVNSKIVRDLWRMRGQALAIAAVIGGGIATLIMSLSTMDSLERTRSAYYEGSRFADVFAHATRAPRAVIDVIAALPGVGRADGRIVRELVLDVPGTREPVRARVVSRVAGGRPVLNDVVIRRGRDLQPGHAHEVLVSEAFANANGFEPGHRILANVNERQRVLRIVGIVLSPEFVYAFAPGDLVPDDKRFGVLWMGRDALEAAFDLKGAVNDVVVRLSHGAVEADVIAGIDRVLARYGGTGAYGRADQLSDAFVSSELGQLANMAAVIPPVFLAVAAFLLNVVLARIVETEREQIGLLKAFGYSDREVGWIYLKLVMAIAALGILIGWGGGGWMGQTLTRLYGDNFRFPDLYYVISPATFAVGALVGMGAAALGVLTALRRAVRLAPAVAMAPPTPGAYHLSLAEPVALTRILSRPARMILRHVLRWPLRALLTVAGIAFSVAILIMTLFFIDSVEEMVTAHFFGTERQDMTLSFAGERPGAIRTDVDDLPGVMRVETFRTVPAVLRRGPRSERVAIQGIAADAELSPLIDTGGRTVPVPPAGLVLADKLARLLGVGPGGTVTVAALEGRRRVAEVPVARVVRQYVGLAAYMDRRALNRLMGEGDVVTGARLLYDDAASPALFAKLKQVPALIGIGVRDISFGKFREMLDKNLNTMVFFYIAFASLIAIGVVYNSARISLAERARELATLRVLGYGKGEVGAILAGELALLTVIALPLGCAAGYGLAALMATLFDTKLYRIPLVVAPSTYGVAMLAVSAASAFSAAMVIRRVAAFDLVAVLKTRE